MNLHEYQSKEVFREFGIPVPPGRPARSAEEAVAAAKELGGDLWVVKAQVHAGGRGKAGGVKLARDLDTVRTATADMLGQRLVTRQTGPEGLPIETVYVESGSQIEREIYLSLTLNRERERAFLFRDLATLRTQLPLFADVEQLRWDGPTAAFAQLADRLDARARVMAAELAGM